jgi:signal transduction histidine kinase
MATTRNNLRGRKIGFQTTLRSVVAVQIVVTLLIITALAVATLSARSSGDKIQRLTTGNADVTNVRDVMIASDRSLRAFIESGGDIDAIEGYAGARLAIPVLVARAKDSLNGELPQRLTRWFRAYLVYSDDHREPVIDLVEAGQIDRARALVLGDAGRAGFADLFEDASEIALLAGQQLGDARNRDENLQLAALAVAVMLALALTIFDIVLFRRGRREFTRPLIELSDAARRVGHGDFSTRASGSNVAEIDVVARSFNTMSDELRRRMHELRGATVDRADFVSSVSHELRTPVTSLIGYLEMLKTGEAGELSDEQQAYVDVAERNARQLDTLIGDLLTLSGLEHDIVEINLEPTDISKLILALKAEMLPIARDKNIDLVVVQTGDLVIDVDAVRIRQALANLISNAIKYSDPGQAVVIRAFREDENMAIGVVDWGLGIPADELSRIAEPFYRSSRHTDVPGTGLGLAIAKQMAELHGGRLRVESELGTGSTFTLVIPARRLESVHGPEGGAASAETAADADADEAVV